MSWITDILTTWSPAMYAAAGLTLLGIFIGLFLIIRELAKLRLRPPGAAAEASLSGVKQDLNKPELINGPDLSSGAKPYLIEIVILGQGLNYHDKIRHSSLNVGYELNEKRYNISEGHVYQKNPSLLDQLVWKIKGIYAEYLALFWEGDPEPVIMKKSKVNPQVLARVRTSRALGKALKEMFKTSILDNRGLLFFIIAFGVLAIVILRSMGYV